MKVKIATWAALYVIVEGLFIYLTKVEGMFFP